MIYWYTMVYPIINLYVTTTSSLKAVKIFTQKSLRQVKVLRLVNLISNLYWGLPRYLLSKGAVFKSLSRPLYWLVDRISNNFDNDNHQCKSIYWTA